MAATLGFPFTAAQWKELERQAMIYKYMVASVPVPYQLLLPIIQNLPPPAAQSHPLVRYSSKQDLEPGRCKRTDGKKWRCSRDVAPNHKYCDRHMHRGRPRSRKLVELSKNPTHSNPCKLVGSTILPSPTQQPPPSSFLHLHLHNNKRGWDWSRDGGSEQQWRQIMHTSRSIFNNQFGECFTDFGTDSCGLDLSMAMGLGNTNGMEQGESSQVSGLVSCGGPLAEVLRPPTCTPPYPGDGDSPSQRRMLSVSDASTVCNSSPTPTEIVWFT